MAASRKKRTALRAVLILLLCLALVCVVGAFALVGLFSSKCKALKAGTTYSFDYTIQSTAAEPPALYRLLEQFGGTEGFVSGSSSADKLQLSLYTQADRTTPLTRFFISPEETLYDVEDLYSALRSAVVTQYPLADLLIPQWSLGDYISQTQLAEVLGVDSSSISLQNTTAFQLDWKKLKLVQPENGLDGYLYFQFEPTAADNTTSLILGFAKEDLLRSASPKTHVLLTLPAQQLSIELTGSLAAAQTVLAAPTSRMKDEDIATLVQLRQTIQSVVEFVQSAVG